MEICQIEIYVGFLELLWVNILERLIFLRFLLLLPIPLLMLYLLPGSFKRILGNTRLHWFHFFFSNNNLGIHRSFANVIALAGLIIEFIQICSFSFKRLKLLNIWLTFKKYVICRTTYLLYKLHCCSGARK